MCRLFCRKNAPTRLQQAQAVSQKVKIKTITGQILRLRGMRHLCSSLESGIFLLSNNWQYKQAKIPQKEGLFWNAA